MHVRWSAEGLHFSAFHRMGKAINMKEHDREHGDNVMMDNEEVLLQWYMLNIDVSDTNAADVLGLLVKLWITICVFSFANGWMELYKQSKMKSLQWSQKLSRKMYSC